MYYRGVFVVHVQMVRKQGCGGGHDLLSKDLLVVSKSSQNISVLHFTSCLRMRPDLCSYVYIQRNYPRARRANIYGYNVTGTVDPRKRVSVT